MGREVTTEAQRRVFPNTPASFAQLSTWLEKQRAGRVHACLEATGAYSDSLATYLHEQGHLVSVLNPAQIKAYAESHLTRARTDKADATLIARSSARSATRPSGARYRGKRATYRCSPAASTPSWRCGGWRRTDSG